MEDDGHDYPKGSVFLMSTALDDLLKSLPGYLLLTEAMKNAALSGALIPDADGVWPGQDGYVPTHDVYFAALNLLGFLQAQPVVTNTSSEGTSVTVSKPEWAALVRYYRSQSPIINATGQDVLTRIVIPDVPHVVPTDMSGRGSHYGDINTDIG